MTLFRGGDTRRKKFVDKFTKNWRNEVEQVKKLWGDTLEGGDTRVKAIKSDSNSDSDEQKRSPGFSGKN